MYKKYFYIIIIILLNCSRSSAQNVSSPYSQFGIGDIETNTYGRFAAAGDAGTARREAGYYDYSNPASLTSMLYKSVNYDFAFNGRSSKFKSPGTDSFTTPSKDFTIKRATFAFKVSPTLGFAFGIKPVSSVNYQSQYIANISDGNTYYLKSIDGSGGIYQSYLSAGKQLNKRLSVGLGASWIFGALQNQTEYYSYQLNIDIIRKETKTYYGAGLQGGIQYYSLPNKKWQHFIGITSSISTKLKGQLTSSYSQNDTVLKKIDPTDVQFKMPAAFSFGYAAANHSGLLISAQADYNLWPIQGINYINSAIKNSYGLHGGIEYQKKIKTEKFSIEKYYVGIGFKMEKSYLTLNNESLMNRAVTFGGGKNLSRFLSLNTGVEIGNRGSLSFSQVQEKYVSFSVGVTIKDFWYGTKKFGRYD